MSEVFHRMLGAGRIDLVEHVKARELAAAPDDKLIGSKTDAQLFLEAIELAWKLHQETDAKIGYPSARHVNKPLKNRQHAVPRNFGGPQPGPPRNILMPDQGVIRFHQAHLQGFLAARPGEAFTGVVIMGRAKAEGTRKHAATAPAFAKVYLIPVAPSDKWPSRPRQNPGAVTTRTYSKTAPGELTHDSNAPQGGPNAQKSSHTQALERIIEGRGRKKVDAWFADASWSEGDDAVPGNLAGLTLGFTVVKGLGGQHRFSFTSRTLNTRTAESTENDPNLHGAPFSDWANTVMDLFRRDAAG